MATVKRQLLNGMELLELVRNKRDVELADLEQENERFKAEWNRPTSQRRILFCSIDTV
jgi:hypothetical protein